MLSSGCFNKLPFGGIITEMAHFLLHFKRIEFSSSTLQSQCVLGEN